jgi:hypothetical protein
LFFGKALWTRLGGFSDYRYVLDWDFCLRALGYGPPAILHEPAYDYRLHDQKTMSQAVGRTNSEMVEMLVTGGVNNIKALQDTDLRRHLIACARDCAFLKAGCGHLIDQNHLIELAQGLLGKMAPEAT